LSPALGAFVAGLILAGSPFAAQVRGDMAPLKHIFLTLFFVSIGMLADLPWLFTGYHWVWAISIAIAIVFGKCIIVWIVGMVCKHPLRVSIATGLCLAQIGEFSFVLGAEGLKNGLIKEDQFQLMMSASLLTLLISPLLISKARPITKRISAIFGGTPTLDNEDELVNLRDHIIVLGYGVAGKEVVGELLKSGNQVLVIDIGPNCVRRAKEDGAEVILGNAQRREVLVHARVQHAKLLISTLPDQRASSDSIQHIRAFVPTLKIIARVRYSLYVKQLYSAGADIVVDEESCVGQTLALQSLEQLGQLKKL
jgi:CPA2 family monovalent cation:H+ antiporter-2